MDLGNTVIFYRCFITYKILTLTESCRDIALYGELSTQYRQSKQSKKSDVIRVISSRVMNMHIVGSETDTWTILVHYDFMYDDVSLPLSGSRSLRPQNPSGPSRSGPK